MSPWVRVGPSSTARTRLPAIAPPSPSTEKGELARTISAVGFSSAIDASTASTPSGGAESSLLITQTSAIRRFVSPGW